MFKKINEKIEYGKEKYFWILFSVFAFFLFSYGFLLEKSAIHAVNNEKLKDEMAVLNTEIDSLGFKYLDLKSSITEELALSKGFVLSNGNSYAYAGSKSDSLSLNKTNF